ncbi:PREDICTED: E3 ubiquitin/ISG15 ligase TRIM25-like [Nanorana parkeri]|uniref:E3 ubiquitin/ISG15 ligase TRIM25-like n=1 Tax=Nanorana parkeri TaxID=125878 RepID=UPI000854EC7F|nr:PREDICTED: E3 ubiquitin/ISG15 ligase TRIM25-like [Nanorana parkeri]
MSFLRDELNCSICLSLYSDPVMLYCGHNFCRGCIVQVLDNHDPSMAYTCPECRTEFQQRPTLLRNLKLCNIVEHLCPRQQEQQEEANLFCTYCEFDIPAIKSCRRCETFLCGNHLKKHNKSVEHLLTEPSTFLKNRKCSLHKEFLKYYCSQDSTCICDLCYQGGPHRGHPVELLTTAAERKLQNSMMKLIRDREELEGKVGRLKAQKRKVQEQADTLRKGMKAFFTMFMKEIKILQKMVLAEISRQKGHALLQTTDHIQRLETRKDELSKKIYRTEELLHISDPLTVLMEEPENDKSLNVQDVTVYLDETPIQLVLNLGLSRLVDISTELKENISMPKVSSVLMDVSTACNYIFVSRDLKSASYVQINQGYPDGPERFTSCQVLGGHSFDAGQCYFEVDVSKAKEWIVGLAYNSMERKTLEKDSYIGYNDKSWSLEYRNGLLARHDNITDDVTLGPPMQLLGVYINVDTGQLSFYQLCDQIRHLYTFSASFTEGLHAAFYIFPDSCISVH